MTQLLLTTALIFFAAPAPSPTPASAPASATQQATSGNPTIDAILDRLETKGDAIKGISTKLIYNDTRFEPVEDKVVKNGELLFSRGEPNSKFMIRFDETIAGGVKRPNREYYLFDGTWFTERNDGAKQVIKRQVVRPGEHIDPFKIGKGPFPLPFGQRRAEMLKFFTITLEKPKADDPPNTDHLHCVPRPEEVELARKYKRLDMWVDKKLELPVRIEVERLSDENIIDVRFENMDPTGALAESRFQIDTPPGKDWEIREEPIQIQEPLDLDLAPGVKK